MSSISVFSGSFCREESVLEELSGRTDYRLLTDNDVVEAAAKASGMARTKLENAFSAKTSVFNKFTHEKERSIAHLRLALAEALREDGLLAAGFVSQLIPRDISHILRVCLIADMKFRSARAQEAQEAGDKGAVKAIHRQDGDRAAWVEALQNKRDPWDPSLYDLVIPIDKTTVKEAAELIMENLAKPVIQPTLTSEQAAENFLLASKVEVALAKEGHNVAVSARGGSVTIVINKHVLMLGRLEEDLKSIASGVPGVRSIETKVGKGFYQADIYRKYDFQMPSKVLLVDDEREFVQTLSERLLMRDMGSAVAYDGESALALVREDEPEVMILDLKMPGIDGIEVLRRVKKTRPEIEVVILTGHGSEADREVCMALGAFAYLQKPVDIDVLSETLKKANEKMRENIEAAKAG